MALSVHQCCPQNNVQTEFQVILDTMDSVSIFDKVSRPELPGSLDTKKINAMSLSMK